MHLGQLPADGDRALRVELGEHRERRGEPPWRFERDERAAALTENAAQLGAAARQEAHEAPAVGGKRRGDQRRQRRGRPG